MTRGFGKICGKSKHDEIFWGLGDVPAAALLQHQHILDAHAETAGQVDPRLSGDHRPHGEIPGSAEITVPAGSGLVSLGEALGDS